MGIQDRDYYREGSNGFLHVWGRQGVVVWIIVLTTIVFFLECRSGPPILSDLCRAGDVSAGTVMAGEVWRLITATFLHASLWHLFFNMLVLYWAGTRIEELYGSLETIGLYLAAGVFSNGVYVAAQLAGLSAQVPAIGASGAVTAIFVIYAFHFPTQQVLLFFILRLPIWVVVILFIAMDVFGAATGRGGVAFFAHLGGALFGALFYQSGIRLTRLFRYSAPVAARQRVRPQLRVISPEPEDDDEPLPENPGRDDFDPPAKGGADEQLEAQLDRILEKVSTQGQESLTPEERGMLVKASELYKKRRR
jgi:membrane associated rhomboid family serine protease